MTTTTDPDQESSFRLSMLLNDTRYRSLTFQAIAAILLALAIWFLGNNLILNLREAGLNISYDFLGDPAGYDINQTLVEYDSQSSHLRAAVVGVLNTLLVAFLACVTATVLGVIAGVLRLSKNWLVRKLMAFYVEIFRNIPVLIWIIIIFTIMTAVMPAPSAFRGTEPDADLLFGSLAATNRGVYTPLPVLGPGGWIFLVSIVLSILGVIFYRRFATKRLYDRGQLLPMGWPSVAILVAPALIVWLAFSQTVGGARNVLLVPEAEGSDVTLSSWLDVQGRATLCQLQGSSASVVAKNALLRERSARLEGPVEGRVDLNIRSHDVASRDAAVEAFQTGDCDLLVLPQDAVADDLGVPLSTQLPEGHPIELDKPYLSGFNFTDGIQIGAPLIALWFALAIYTGAFIAENVRAGIQAVSKGQTEAASALGLRPGRVMNLVVLPQALRVIIPPLISQYLNITKNSSLAIAVGYADITATLGGITLNQTGRAIECVLMLMLFYLVISLTISAVMNVYNKSVALKER